MSGDEGRPPELTKEEIQEILRFLPTFSAPGFKAGGFDSPEGQLPYCDYSPEVHEFMETLYRLKVVFPFDWIQWQPTAEPYLNDPTQLATASQDTLCKLLTLHARQERFSEGHLLAAFESGHMVAILNRLDTIAKSMA